MTNRWLLPTLVLSLALAMTGATGCTGASCRMSGETCTADTDCCNGACVAGTCVGTGGSTCHVELETCGSAADCCGSGACTAGVCGSNSCQAVGDGCSRNAQCCNNNCNTSTGRCQ